jgi:hypothetical protein
MGDLAGHPAEGVALVLVLAVFIGRSPYRLLSDSGLRIPPLWRYPIEAAALAGTVFWASLVCYVAYRRLGHAPPDKNVKLAALVSGACLGVLAAVPAFLLPITLSNPYGDRRGDPGDDALGQWRNPGHPRDGGMGGTELTRGIRAG